MLNIRQFDACDQTVVRRLILEGLGEHFGFIDESLNPDLDDIMAHYVTPGHVFLVAQSEDVIIGTGALITVESEIGRIVRLSVSRAYRRQGLGRALVMELVDIACQRSHRRVLVETTHDWHDAIALYERCGFRQFDRDPESVHLVLEL